MDFTITRGKYSAVVTTAGGELVSYRAEDGPEYIWQGDPASWTGRNPILFPIVGKLRGGTVLAGAHECHMPQHGLARQREFSLTEQGEDFILLEQYSDRETLAAYPFPYLLQVRHTLTDTGFTTTATVTNTGDEDMPFCLGAHTAFRCPLHEGERFEDYVLLFDEAESLPALLPTEDGLLSWEKKLSLLEESSTIALNHALFDKAGTLVFNGPRSGGVSLRHHTGGHGVHVDFTGFPMVAFWTPLEKKAPFLCIEPWQGCAAFEDESGRFADKPHAVVLRPGAFWSIGYTVTTLPGA